MLSAYFIDICLNIITFYTVCIIRDAHCIFLNCWVTSPKNAACLMTFSCMFILEAHCEDLHVCISCVILLVIVCFIIPHPCVVCLWSTGPPLHCSSASSSTPVEQLPFPPPTLAANESQGQLLGNCAPQQARDSDSEDEFAPGSFLVKNGSGNLYAPATGTAHGELVFKLPLLSRG